MEIPAKSAALCTSPKETIAGVVWWHNVTASLSLPNPAHEEYGEGYERKSNEG
jgi:hypothetical protein